MSFIVHMMGQHYKWVNPNDTKPDSDGEAVSVPVEAPVATPAEEPVAAVVAEPFKPSVESSDTESDKEDDIWYCPFQRAWVSEATAASAPIAEKEPVRLSTRPRMQTVFYEP